jgi:uncharacterized protein (TIGR00255 family)
MIVSMTGFGKASRTTKKIGINIELRSINSKFLEVAARMSPALTDRESEIKEIIGQKVTRGKVTVIISVDRGENTSSLKLKPEAIKDYYKLIAGIKKATGIKEEIKLDHILKFSEIFKGEDNGDLADCWNDIKKVFSTALSDLVAMKKKEGRTLEKDIMYRINSINKKLDIISKLSAKNIKKSKDRMLEKVYSLIAETNIETDKNRLEYELVMISDRLDITEEVIRAKSHIEYFKNNVKDTELSGRRLNFLVQEINREINTMASKSSSSEISQFVVEMKEELEKIKEQLQNIE